MREPQIGDPWWRGLFDFRSLDSWLQLLAVLAVVTLAVVATIKLL